jgi:hypothetical protein
MPVTPEQLEHVRNTISNYHWAFVANTIGPEMVPKEILEELKEAGLVDIESEFPREAYQFGSQAAQDAATKRLSLKEYQSKQKQDPPRMAPQERNAVQWAKQNAADSVTAMGDQMKVRVSRKVVEAVQSRRSVKALKLDLGHLEEDWSRDWDRVAVTEVQNSMEAGTADSIEADFGPEEMVSKIPAPDACPHCNRLHLGPDGHPYIFKLSELRANGTNVGKKVADWQAVVGTIHPNCACMMVRVPTGWGYDETGSLVPKGKYGTRTNDLKKSIAEAEENYPEPEHTTFCGIPIAIENRAGSQRHWTDSDGTKGSAFMRYDYGYIVGMIGADNDELDVYVGPQKDADTAYVMHQQNKISGIYDEDKVMLGFASKEEAVKAYQSQYDSPEFLAGVSDIGIDGLKKWLESHKEVMRGVTQQDGTPLILALGKSFHTESTPSRAQHHSPSMLAGDAANQVFDAPQPEAQAGYNGLKEFIEEGKKMAQRAPAPNTHDHPDTVMAALNAITDNQLHDKPSVAYDAACLMAVEQDAKANKTNLQTRFMRDRATVKNNVE